MENLELELLVLAWDNYKKHAPAGIQTKAGDEMIEEAIRSLLNYSHLPPPLVLEDPVPVCPRCLQNETHEHDETCWQCWLELQETYRHGDEG